MCRQKPPSQYEGAQAAADGRRMASCPIGAAAARRQSNPQGRIWRRAFYSLDAAFAALAAVLAYSMFALLLSSAAQSASSAAEGQSKTMLAFRFSSFILEDAGVEHGGLWGSSYAKRSELDLGHLREIDLGKVRATLGADFASISLSDQGGIIFRSESGVAQGQVFCASRIALLSRKIVRLEACIS